MPEIIVNDPMPPEDEISKTLLWQKIDLTRSVIESHRSDLDARMDQIASTIQNSFDDQMTAIVKNMEFERLKLEQTYKDYVKHMESVLTKHREDLEVKSVDNEKSLEAKVASLISSIDAIVNTKSSDYYSQMFTRLSAVEDATDTAAKSMNHSLSQYQTEVRDKISKLNEKFEDILGHFRRILKGI